MIYLRRGPRIHVPSLGGLGGIACRFVWANRFLPNVGIGPSVVSPIPRAGFLTPRGRGGPATEKVDPWIVAIG